MTEQFGIDEITAVLEPVYVSVDNVVETVTVQSPAEPVYVTIDNVTETLVIEASPAVSVVVPPRQSMCDLISAVEAYVGYSAPGTATSDAAWQICHVVDTSEGPVTTWARSGTGSLSNLVWDDRLSYTWP